MVNSCANNIQHTENNKQCQKSKLSLEQILVSFCMSSLSPLIFLPKAQPDDLVLSLVLFTSSRKNKTTSTCISISEFVKPYVVDIRLFNPAPVRNTVKTCNSWLLSHITIQPLHQLSISKEYLTSQKCQLSHVLPLE